MNASARVLAPETPMYLLGAERGPVLVRQRRPTRHVRAPQTPLYQLGYAELGSLGQNPAGAIVGSTAPIAQSATSSLLASTSVGAWAGPIGAGVGLVVGLIGGLLGGAAKRAAQARNENHAVQLGLDGFDSDLKQIQSAYKAGQIDLNGALQAVSVVLQNYWTVVTPQIQPNRNGCQSGSNCPPDTSAQGRQPCQGNIGAGCCVACYQLQPSITGPNGVLAALQGQSGSSRGPYVADIHNVAGSHYGLQTRAAYTLDFTPPPASVSGAGALASMFGSSSSGSLMPLVLIGGLLYMATR